ncbi:hypothetical protein AB0H00_29935 [Nocardia sp. NPDC023852]|uniref:hypothetical protein n=1 Tax=Nocardia sp. NPDC023852 TaxID=3154697 RepID=UPI0033C07F5A
MNNPNNSRPKSTTAQRITALAAVLTLVAVVVATVVSLQYLQRLADWYADRNPHRPPTVAVFQEHCLDYTRYVLDQHRAGMNVEQITATLDRAATVADQFHTSGQRLHDPTACGTPEAILHTAGLR